MSRETKTFTTAHLYPLYIVMHMQFGDWCAVCTAIFNIAPIFFVSSFFTIWINSSHIRLSRSEKRSLYFFVYFFIIAHSYYAICALIQNNPAGQIWIIKHNAYFVYFVIFIALFYFFQRAKQQWQ